MSDVTRIPRMFYRPSVPPPLRADGLVDHEALGMQLAEKMARKVAETPLTAEQVAEANAALVSWGPYVVLAFALVFLVAVL